MARNKKAPEINLLPQEEFEASAIGRVLKWLLGTFRYIVISTEMIVMIAFLSRFWLDARSADLVDAINQKKAIVASYKTFEGQFRSTQDKITLFNKFGGDNLKMSPVIKDISSAVSSDITLSEIVVNGGKVEITAVTQNESSASNFIANLNNSAHLTNVGLEAVESKQGTTSLSFTIKATIKGGVPNGS